MRDCSAAFHLVKVLALAPLSGFPFQCQINWHGMLEKYKEI